MPFQELIQNAEDAGASQVKFLHDKHSHGTEKLHSDGLAQFQVRSNFKIVADHIMQMPHKCCLHLIWGHIMWSLLLWLSI